MRTLQGFRRDESGQVLPMVAVMLVMLLGMAGLVVDVGHAYYCHRELQMASDAAALAGAGSLLGTTPQATAMAYSAVQGGQNQRANLDGVKMMSGYPKLRCLTTLKNQGVACAAPSNANAITVVQQATVPMYFAVLFGKTSMSISASATAAMRGAGTTPNNVMIVLDSTGSMNDFDSDSNCAGTRESCAQAGVRVLLNNLAPCGTGLATCGPVTDGNVANAVDKVALMTFPGVSSATEAANDFNCGGRSPEIAPYSYPTLPTYQIVNWSSDYRTSSSAKSLTSSSNLVVASGGANGCTGLRAIGGEGTYYAGVIYAAQAALAAASSKGTQNIMIVLSDGDANASSKAMPGASTSTGTYPSTRNQCAQAVTAAQAATAAGTRVYTIAYGANANGCFTDTSGITPCQTMQQMASSAQYFYSDYTAAAGSGSCISASQPVSGLNQIFTQIAGDLTLARLIPDDTP